MEITEKTVLELVHQMYPDEPQNNLFARETKSGDWEVGYTNDLPLQHGNGRKFVCPLEVIKVLIKTSTGEINKNLI